MRIDGLTDFQNDLLNVERKAEKVFKEAMRVSGNKATRHVRKKAKTLVKVGTGNKKKEYKKYHKAFKRGKVFVDGDGEITTRVLNTAHHGHLIEYGHRNVVNPGKGRGNGRGVIPGRGIGREVGFTPGLKVMEKGMREFEEKREDINEISKALDKLLSQNRL